MAVNTLHYAALALALSLGIGSAHATEVWPSAIAQVERGLQSPDITVRRAAAARLVDLPASAISRLLPMVFSDADAEVRLTAAGAAKRLPLLPQLRVSAWLRDPDLRLRHAAAELLERAPDVRTIPDLVRSLGDGEALVRGAVVEALAATGHSEVVLPLLGRIDDPDAEVRERVLSALSMLGDPRATLPLIGKLQDQRPQVRSRAARAIAELRDPRAVSALMLALSDPEPEVQIAVAHALGKLQAVQAVDALVPLSRSLKNEGLTGAALSALAGMNSPRAAAALVQGITAEDDEISQMALRSMANASELVLDPLTQCLAGQPNERVANACVAALARFGGERAGHLVLSALERRVVSGTVALPALGELGFEPALPSALGLLSSPDREVQRSAVELVVRLLDPERPDGRAVDPLLRALAAARAQPALQHTLVVALGRTASPRASSALLPYLSDKLRTPLRLAAIEACGLTAAKGTAHALLPLLDDRSPELRLTSALALRRIADGQVFAELWQRLTQAPAQDRGAVAIALGGSLKRASNQAQLQAVVREIRATKGELKDVLIESLSFVPGRRGVALLLEVAEQATQDATRAKVAEVLAARAEGAPYLVQLAQSKDERVRANVAWSLGNSSTARAALEVLMRDDDHAVAANAVASLARVESKLPELRSLLCAALSDARAYVRVNALVGLRIRGQRCADGVERRLLVADQSASVRRAAALLIGAVKGPEAAQDELARARCREQEVEPAAAAACEAHGAPEPEAKSSPLTVFAIPHNSSHPVPQAPFALITGSGFIRSGWTDQRGAVFQMASTKHPVRLVVPPQFVTVE